MNLELFIQNNNFDTQRPQHPTPQVYLDKMLYLFDGNDTPLTTV